MDPSANLSIAVRVLAKICPWAVSKFFTEERLDALVDIQPSTSGECIDLNFPSRRATCWIRVVNLTPFRLKLDRIEIKIMMDGLSVGIIKVLPVDILSLARESIFCEGSFDCDPAALEMAKKTQRARLEIRGYVICSARSFSYYRDFNDLVNFRVQ